MFLGGQKRPFFGGPKSPILARGHMGKTAVFNQIVLYLETPNLDQKGPFGAKLTPSKKGAPGIAFVDAKLMTLATRPQGTNLYITRSRTRLNSIKSHLI